MKQDKCFFKIQIPVCRITMQARGFAVWTTPTPRGDWNNSNTALSCTSSMSRSESPLHREVIETDQSRFPRQTLHTRLNHPYTARWLKQFVHDVRQRIVECRIWTTPTPRGDWTENPDIRKDTGIFSIKKLKNSAQPGIYSERWW